jgi:hypothetical protein
MMRADLRKCKGKTGGPSARGRTASSSSPSFVGVPSQLDHTPGGRVLELPDILGQVAGRSSSHLASRIRVGNPDLARDHSYWVLPRPNDLCYAGPVGRSAASPEIALMLGSPEPRCISPKLPENSSLTTFGDCRTGSGPAHLSRYEYAGPRPCHRWRSFQARTFSDCAIDVPLLARFESQRPGAEPAPEK